MIQLRPSSSHVWTHCHAFPRFSANVPTEPESDAAREGTCAAWVAEMRLTGEVNHPSELIGKNHANGWIVDETMARHIEAYVRNLVSDAKPSDEIHTERKVRLNDMIAGTPDAFAILNGDTLRVDDLKYGFKIVEPFRNPQVSIYAGALIRSLAAKGIVIRRVVIGIYQPRAWHPAGIYRTWTVRPEDLMQYVHEIEKHGVGCQNPSAPATPGAHCEYCPAAATCYAITHTVYELMSVVENVHQGTMSAQQIASELEFLERATTILKGRTNAVKTEATARIKRGETLPGYHLEHPLGDRQFKVKPEIIEAITGLKVTETKAITPAAFGRDKRVSPELVASLTYRPQRPPVLKKIPHGYYSNMFKKPGE